MGAEQAIMTEGLAKRFGAVQALAGVDPGPRHSACLSGW
jgi:hypothetical protein